MNLDIDPSTPGMLTTIVSPTSPTLLPTPETTQVHLPSGQVEFVHATPQQYSHKVYVGLHATVPRATVQQYSQQVYVGLHATVPRATVQQYVQKVSCRATCNSTHATVQQYSQKVLCMVACFSFDIVPKRSKQNTNSAQIHVLFAILFINGVKKRRCWPTTMFCKKSLMGGGEAGGAAHSRIP